MALESQTVAALMEHAHRLHRRGDFEGAAAGYDRVLVADPTHAPAHHLLGVIAAQKGDAAEAARRIARAIEIEPTNPAFHCNLGNALAEQDRLAAAVESYRQALRLRPDYAEAHYNLGKARFLLGDFEEAAAGYRAALEFQPRHVGAALGLAEVRAREDDLPGAIEVLQAVRAVAPDEPDLLNNMGQYLQRAGRLAEALQTYERLLQLRPDHQAAHFGLSTLFARLGQAENAKKAAQNAIRLRPILARQDAGDGRARLLVLHSMEQQHFTPGRGMSVSNANNAVAHLDRQRWNPSRVFVDEGFLEHTVPQLPPFDLVYNAITEADNCPRSLAEARVFVEGLACPVINRPDRVALTTREGNYRRFRDLPGLLYPRTVRVVLGGAPVDRLRAVLADEGFNYPVIIRRSGTHGGQTAVKVDDDADLEEAGEQFGGADVHIIQFIDFRDSGGLFRKLRTIAMVGQIYPAALYYDQNWNTHSGRGRDFMETQPWTQAEEDAFLGDMRAYLGERNVEILHAIDEAVGLDYYGMDFAMLEDGQIVIFEINAAMYHGMHYVGRFPYLERWHRRLIDATRSMFDAKLQEARRGGA